MGVYAYEIEEATVTRIDIRKSAARLSNETEVLAKASEQIRNESQAHTIWVPQRVNFGELMSFTNPYHMAAINLKASVAFGLGTEGVDESALIGNPIDTWHDVTQLAAQDYAGCGNAYLEVARSLTTGKIEEVYWLPARETEISKDQLLFRQIGADGKEKIFRRFGVTLKGEYEKYNKAHEVIHFANPSNWSSYYGGPSWIGALPPLILADAAYAWNQDFFTNHCIPAAIVYLSGKTLQTKQDLTEAEVAEGKQSEEEQLQEYLKNNFGQKGKRNRVLVLTGGDSEGKLQVQQLGQPVKDGDFLKLIQQCRDDILSGHGVPPRMVGVVVGGSLGGSGEALGQLKLFRDLVIAPMQRVWESRLNSTLFKELGGKIKFNQIDPEAYATATPGGTTGGNLPTVEEGRVELSKGDPREALILRLNSVMERLSA